MKNKLIQLAVYLTETSLVMLLLPGFTVLLYATFWTACFLLDINYKNLVEGNLVVVLILSFISFLASGSLVAVVVWVAGKQPLKNYPTSTLESRRKSLEFSLTSMDRRRTIHEMELVSVKNELSRRKEDLTNE